MIYVVSVSVFVSLILILVFILYIVEKKVIAAGDCSLTINDDESKKTTVSSGTSLLSALSDTGIFLPSACGGGGTCAMCKVQVLEGGGEALPTETPHLTINERKTNVRLGCQVKVKSDMKVKVPDEIFSIKKYECEVVSNYNVASFIKEFVVKLPEGENLNFEAGGYVQLDVPTTEVDFKTMDIAPHPDDPAGPEKFKAEWDRFKLWNLKMVNEDPLFRAYSMANHPAEGNIVILNIRIATPPWDRSTNGWKDVNPGICSSYIFGLKPGDKITLSGPYGEFFIKDTGSEMIYVGGGAGMAPMRSHLFHLFNTLKTGRKVTFWYGGRSKRELFYVDQFRDIEKKFPNFKFNVVLSEPQPEDNWSEKDGYTGFVHNAVIEHQLEKHDSPEDIEFYFCGPPMMNKCVIEMCDNWGIPPENIAFDDFGG
ncbi:NADH:ubiquinone reductase (Na(+)-transporting) subunit F [Candidatus Marinamargulisbacteria bacterium SCGC AAA071-K20]|nr:NADH:ubiquinone reductase (Na(+)-transporting) subunit F [Candidatus Marinamargulisbacteria bacterium SCGC AAA071-K20]